MNKRFLIINRLLFLTTAILILVLSILSKDALNRLYLFFACVISIDAEWIRSNAVHISNVGHIIACFALTCLGFSVIKKSLIKNIMFVASFAVLGELIQFFVPTRQTKLEDIAFSVSGIFLAATLFILKRKFAVSHLTER